jgi:phage shock protein A
MLTLTNILIVGGVALLILAVLNRRAFTRLFSAASAQVGKVGRAAQEADPLAMYQEAVDDGVENIQRAKRGLEQSKSLVRSVERQVDQGRKEKARLEHRIQTVLDQGDPNGTVNDYALQLAEVEQNLATNEAQLKTHTESYNNFCSQVELGQKKVADARRKAATLGMQLQQSQREKEMADFASTFSPTGFDSDGTLARAEALINQKIDTNRAAGDVANDLSRQGLAEAADEKLERDAAAASILERFKKSDAS